MQRLGRTLEDVLRKHGPVLPSTAAQLGYDIVCVNRYSLPIFTIMNVH